MFLLKHEFWNNLSFLQIKETWPIKLTNISLFSIWKNLNLEKSLCCLFQPTPLVITGQTLHGWMWLENHSIVPLALGRVFPLINIFIFVHLISTQKAGVYCQLWCWFALYEQNQDCLFSHHLAAPQWKTAISPQWGGITKPKTESDKYIVRCFDIFQTSGISRTTIYFIHYQEHTLYKH